TGTLAEGNVDGGILISSVGTQSNGNTIGGLTPASRNVISGNAGVNLHIEPSDSNLIQGNFIRTDVTGTAALSSAAGFRSGLFVGAGNNNKIGGPTAEYRNIISGNPGIGVETYVGSSNRVEGNYIGTDVSGTKAVANRQGISYNTTGTDASK